MTYDEQIDQLFYAVNLGSPQQKHARSVL